MILRSPWTGILPGSSAPVPPSSLRQRGTWITADIISAYIRLHKLGYAHSAESYRDGRLVGGCYGIRLGRVFFGESMFSKENNASKAAFLSLAQILFADDLAFIDCQVYTAHLESLGGEEIGRNDYLAILRGNLGPRQDHTDRRGNWGPLYKEALENRSPRR